jgi:uncharacterized phage-associated protein
MVYYAQAWSVVLRETELFPEEIRAWRHGPVVEEVYQALPSGRCAACVPPDTFANAPDLGAEDALFGKSLWEAYNQSSASQLYRMTHAEMPWRKTWGDRPANMNGNDPIPTEYLEEYFSKQPVPGPLAAYFHDLRKREEEAEKKLLQIPPLDINRLKAGATSFTPAAGPKTTGV